jgi:hypothetical protein
MDETKGNRVLGLVVENVKKIKAVTITPDPNSSAVLIAGNNEDGKSSILDSISYAIGGKKLIPKNPIRDGEDKARIQVDLDEFIVTRLFKRTLSGYDSTLKVIAKDGASISNGQQVMDRLIGKLTFDPLEFATADLKVQREMLRSLITLPIDLAQWQVKYDDLFQKRYDAGRDLKTAQGALDSAKHHDDAPAQLVDVSRATRDLTEGQREIQAHKDAVKAVDDLDDTLNEKRADLEVAKQNVEELKKKLRIEQATVAEIEKAIPVAEKLITKNRAELEAMELPDITALSETLTSADTINQKVRDNQRCSELIDEVKTKHQAHANLEAEIKKHLAVKAKAYAEAKGPKGIQFTDDDITYNGVTLEQISDGAKIKISMELAMSMNPNLKIVLMRRGALLDAKNRQMLIDMATAAGYQLWLELVDPGPATLVIEDGAVKE